MQLSKMSSNEKRGKWFKPESGVKVAEGQMTSHVTGWGGWGY